MFMTRFGFCAVIMVHTVDENTHIGNLNFQRAWGMKSERSDRDVLRVCEGVIQTVLRVQLLVRQFDEVPFYWLAVFLRTTQPVLDRLFSDGESLFRDHGCEWEFS